MGNFLLKVKLPSLVGLIPQKFWHGISSLFSFSSLCFLHLKRISPFYRSIWLGGGVFYFYNLSCLNDEMSSLLEHSWVSIGCLAVIYQSMLTPDPLKSAQSEGSNQQHRTHLVENFFPKKSLCLVGVQWYSHSFPQMTMFTSVYGEL